LKTLIEYGIFDGEWMNYESKLCGAASSLDYPHTTRLSFYINELTFSYFNQWQFVMDAYQELAELIKHLNTFSAEPAEINGYSAYDLHSIGIETQCRDYAFLMITSIKTLLDLFACLVDVTTNRELRPEYQMPDIKNITKKLTDRMFQPVLRTMESFLNSQSYPWLDLVCTYRNRLIHRGYTLKPSFGFIPSSDLRIKLYKGNFAEEELFEIGKLFEQFITDLPKMEDKICLAFSQCLPALSDGPSVEIHYRSSGGATEYFEKSVKEI
jgi:hypothetical protein